MYHNIRTYSSNRYGKDFSGVTKKSVWGKALTIPGEDPAIWRMDNCGALIKWSLYGDTTPEGCGWEIDHILPVSAGGDDNLSNLQPLQWQNNREKGEEAVLACAVRQKGK